MSLFRTQKRRSTGRIRDQRGAALVESAIIIMPLCIILFGIVEFGFVFKDSLTLSSATRAGARTASAATKSTGMMTAASGAAEKAASAAKFQNGDSMLIYKADDTTGLPPTTCSSVTNCVKYTFASGVWGSGNGDWPAAEQQACLGGQIDSVGVVMNLKHQSITGFFPFVNNMKLQERTVMRLEPDTEQCP